MMHEAGLRRKEGCRMRISACAIGVVAIVLAGCGSSGDGSAKAADGGDDFGSARNAAARSSDPTYVLGHTMTTIDGTSQPLEAYRGQVVLVVNVASKCGLTPQYEQLEALYRRKKDDGLVILGFPANDFMNQEPGTNAEILQFCTDRYNVTFPMFEKISVKGDEAHPLYRQLAMQPEPIGGPPEWNFAKYLISRDGRVIARFPSRMRPDEPAFLEAVDAALAGS